ncbi:MAG: four helix bundle protein [Sphingobacteriales bacterium]|nr:four helix bundle protein [Sphingobacteriales bacterium]MBI3717117.1 four helix bundle protein [Sphingobacteriales bacterium]
MRDYKKYEVWVKSHELVLFVYKELLPQFPKSEQYELASQLKRASYSVPLNIVEGCGRKTDSDFAHFLDMALGSAHEAEYCGLLTFELNFISKKSYEAFTELLNEVKAKLINLIKSIRKDK